MSKSIKNCPVCDKPVYSRVECIMDHFAFYAPGNLVFWRGNIKAFGFWYGLRSSLCLSFPWINMILYWKYRKDQLLIPTTPDNRNEGKP